MNRWEIGLLGEWQAARFLKKQGMRILARRFRTGHGEIDLIGRDGETLVFIEVKARPGGRLNDGLRAVGPDKRRHLRSAAAVYLAAHPAPRTRFDVVEITAAGPRHIKNAF